jgi:hypothetical protein
MATYGLDDVSFILIDGYQIGGYINEFTEKDRKATLEDTTCCGDSWVERSFAGQKTAGFSIGGFFDDADDASNEALAEQYAARTICYSLEGNATGCNVVMMSGPMESVYSRVARRGELQKVKADIEGSGGVEDGKLIAPLAARTTAGNTQAAPVDNGAASADGGAVYLQMSALALGGSTNVIVKLRDSADNTTFTDVTGGAFTAVTAAPAKERLAIAGTIKQYTAISWAYTGAGSNQTWTGMVGLHRN